MKTAKKTKHDRSVFNLGKFPISMHHKFYKHIRTTAVVFVSTKGVE